MRWWSLFDDVWSDLCRQYQNVISTFNATSRLWSKLDVLLFPTTRNPTFNRWPMANPGFLPTLAQSDIVQAAQVL